MISSNIPLRGRVDVNATSCACWGRSPNCGICLENVSGLKEYLAFCFENSLNRGQSFSFFLFIFACKEVGGAREAMFIILTTATIRLYMQQQCCERK